MEKGISENCKFYASSSGFRMKCLPCIKVFHPETCRRFGGYAAMKDTYTMYDFGYKIEGDFYGILLKDSKALQNIDKTLGWFQSEKMNKFLEKNIESNENKDDLFK